MDEDIVDEETRDSSEDVSYNSDLIRDIISLGVDSYPERNIDNSNLIIIIPFSMLESFLEVLNAHRNEKSIIWHGNPIIDSRIEFIIPGYSFLPITNLIRPGPLAELVQDYYDTIMRKDKYAFDRLNTELTNSNEFSISSSANFGIDALLNDHDFDGEIKITLRFDTEYYKTFNYIMEDKDHFLELPPNDEENLVQENNDAEFENYLNEEAREEENYFALLEETLLAQQISNQIQEGNFDALVNATLEATAYDYNDYLNDNIVGFGVGSKIKNSKQIIKDFDRNITNLIYYYPDHTKIARLVDAKQKILTFLKKKSFK